MPRLFPFFFLPQSIFHFPLLSLPFPLFDPFRYSNDMHKLFSAFSTALAINLSFGLLLSVTAIDIVKAEVYKQVNPDGSVEFTDVPKSDDEAPLPLRPMSTFKAPAVTPISSSPTSSKSTAIEYTNVSITSPANEATIRDNAGNLTVTAKLTPSLQPGHKIVLFDNGTNLGESTSGSFTLSNVDRGTHVLSVQVQDASGKVLLASKPVTVFLHRQSVLRRP